MFLHYDVYVGAHEPLLHNVESRITKHFVDNTKMVPVKMQLNNKILLRN